jgi:hypothetical protein
MIQKYEINELLDNLQDYLFPGLFSNKNIRKDDIYPKQSFLPSIYYDNN